jgi:hypothetical protein
VSPSRRFPWARWPDERLLLVRIRDLGVQLEGTWMADCVAELYDELDQRNIRLKPHVWVSDEWFSPDGVSGFALPFYLLHPRLIQLERAQLIEVEGGTHHECLKIMRHECGHAIQHGYQLQRRREWQRLFGKSSVKYPEAYRPNPASKRYVQHLRRWYAQSHPDEDFAETFAVWLRSRSDWRRRYAGWPALQKLEYVDRLMAEIAGVVPPARNRRVVDPIRGIRRTLFEHYTERRAIYSVEYPRTYDDDLLRLFSDSPRHRARPTAAGFLRRHRSDIRRLVSRWTGEYQFSLDQVLTDMIGRCRELRLRTIGNERQLLTDFMVLLTARTMSFLVGQGRRDWIAV